MNLLKLLLSALILLFITTCSSINDLADKALPSGASSSSGTYSKAIYTELSDSELTAVVPVIQ